jgi:hypothetical protein
MTAFDQETGEISDSPIISEQVNRRDTFRGSELNMAMHKILEQLPVWIKQDEFAEVEYKTGAKRKTPYATLKAIMSVVRPIALANGVRIKQGCDHAWQVESSKGKGRVVPVITDMIHSATGQSERTTIEIPLFNLDAQAMGSAVSYGRRYGILAALGLTTDEADDDGAAAQPKRGISGSTVEETQELWNVKAEIRECETLKDITDWGKKADETGRIEKLSDDEAKIAHVFYSDRLKALRFKNEPDGKKAK